MSSTRIIARLNELISRGEKMRTEFKNFPVTDYYGSRLSLDKREQLDQWKLSCLNLIEIVSGKKSKFYEAFPRGTIDYSDRTFQESMSHYLSVLRALKEELQMGLLFSAEMLISKDILNTIIEEARTLLQAKYKDAAAIYCRVIIETSLKKLCDKNKITYRKKEKLSTISNKLRKKGFLNLSEWRQVQAWTDIGNLAAHGKFNEYTEDAVKNMLDGIENFLKEKMK